MTGLPSFSAAWLATWMALVPGSGRAFAAGPPETLPRCCARVIRPEQVDSRIRVLGQGSEPRTTLRYPSGGSKPEKLTLVMSQAMVFEQGQQRQLDDLLPRLKLELVVTRVGRPPGLVDVTWRVTSASSHPVPRPGNHHPGLEKLVQSIVSPLASMSFTLTHDVAGQLVRQTNCPLERMPNEAGKAWLGHLCQTIEDSVVPLPEVPVGLGARWTRQSFFLLGMVEVSRTERWRLVGATGKGIELEVESEFDENNPQAIGLGPVPGAHRGKGVGAISLSLHTGSTQRTHRLSADLESPSEAVVIDMETLLTPTDEWSRR